MRRIQLLQVFLDAILGHRPNRLRSRDLARGKEHLQPREVLHGAERKSNFLRATSAFNGKGASISIDNTPIRFNTDRREPGGKVSVFIRPEKLRLTVPGEGQIQGKVTTRYFTGSQWLVSAETPAGVLAVAVPNLGAPPPMEGESIGLAWQNGDCRVLAGAAK